MKNYSYQVLFILCGLLAQSSDGIAACRGNPRLTPNQLVQKIANAWGINEQEYRYFLLAATKSDSPAIVGYENDPSNNPYPSNVLRAARDIACWTQGEGSRVYEILERMLSYK